MFRSKIAFILGAGASCEYKMPLGSDLANSIRQKMSIEVNSIGQLQGSGDISLFLAMQHDTGASGSDMIAAARRLAGGLPLRKSIDDFLDLHQNNSLLVGLGKAAIVKTILEYEKQSSLSFVANHVDATIDFSAISNSWLMKLMRMIGQRDPIKAFENLAFISFNYDRTLERFLFHALRALYEVSNETAAKVLKAVPIFHPYGTVGTLPEMGGQIAFGATLRGHLHVGKVTTIRTYTEEITERATLGAMHGALADADIWVFLGFGFHEQNIELLTPTSGFSLRKKVYGTAFGMSKPDVETADGLIYEMFSENARRGMSVPNSFSIRNDLNCTKLFDEYAATLPRA